MDTASVTMTTGFYTLSSSVIELKLLLFRDIDFQLMGRRQFQILWQKTTITRLT